MSNVKLYTPYSKQKLIHKGCNDPELFFVTVNAGRQSGKSLLAINQALYWGLSKKNRKIYFVSPTAAQAKKVYKQIIQPILDGNKELIKTHKAGIGDTEIIFANDSVIKFRSAAQGDSLRGEDIHYLIVDEGAFIKEEVFLEILFPMLTVLGKKCLIISTPKGKNFFYHHYNKGRSTDVKFRRYASFTFTSSDNPYANQEIIDLARDSFPEVLFNQEYLALFVDNAAIFENVQKLATIKEMLTKPVPGDNYWMGVDIALTNDYTVVCVLNQRYELVYMDRFTNVTTPILKQRLIKTFNLFKPKKIYIEENNQGRPIIDDLVYEEKIKNIKGFITTVSSKPKIINNLMNFFSTNKIKILDDPNVILEFESYTMFQSSNGKVTFSAPNGFHDDIVMSLAIALECIIKEMYTGKIIFM